jgi:hypothetical protein
MYPTASVPPAEPRAVLYGRVSAVMGRGDGLTSPELQKRVTRDYASRRGYDAISWVCDVDRTGNSWSRRQVEQAVKTIEAGDAEVIVVPRWSRFTRNLRDYVIQIARIEAAGGWLESAQEETDPTTAAGLFQRDLFVVHWRSGSPARSVRRGKRRTSAGMGLGCPIPASRDSAIRSSTAIIFHIRWKGRWWRRSIAGISRARA